MNRHSYLGCGDTGESCSSLCCDDRLSFKCILALLAGLLFFLAACGPQPRLYCDSIEPKGATAGRILQSPESDDVREVEPRLTFGLPSSIRTKVVRQCSFDPRLPYSVSLPIDRIAVGENYNTRCGTWQD